jgi:hypothetical protein
MLGPELWVVDVNVILDFGSRRTSVDLGFLASMSRNKCWLGVLNPQWQEISVGLRFSALSVKE